MRRTRCLWRAGPDFNVVDEPIAAARRRHVLPRAPIVAGELDQTVVGARPDGAALQRRLDDRIDGIVDFAPRSVVPERSAPPLTVLLVARLDAAERVRAMSRDEVRRRRSRCGTAAGIRG
jgi:hypothetical protein